MAKHIGLPSHAQAGEKLLRRSMAALARKRIKEANWRQGEIMLGHVKISISDMYAIPDPANLGLALAAIESIIDEIETRHPRALFTAMSPQPELRHRLWMEAKRLISAVSKLERVRGIRPTFRSN